MPPLSYNPKAPDVLLYEHYDGFRRQFVQRHHKSISSVAALFHYTTVEGMQSILAGRSFWATHIGYLNDSSELEYGLTLLKERLTVLASVSKSEFVKVFCKILFDRFGPFYKNFFEVYVVCFCTNGNLLSQWQGYGNGGGGYSIGLAPASGSVEKQTEEAAQSGRQDQLHLREVIYDREEQERLIDAMLSGVASVIETFGPVMHPEAFRAEVLEDAVQRVDMMLANILPCFKSDVFSEEREWRYIGAIKSEVQHLPRVRCAHAKKNLPTIAA